MKLLTIALLVVLFACTSCGQLFGKEEGTTAEPEKIEFQVVSDYVTTIYDPVDLYTEPNESSKVYTTVKNDVELHRTGTSETWTRILLNGSNVYVKNDLVVFKKVEFATASDALNRDAIIFLDPAKQILEDKTTELKSPQEKEEDQDSQYLPALSTKGDADEKEDESKKEKARMGSAAVGSYSGTFEYELTLKICEEVKKKLEAKGYTVYLSRSSDNVNISNAERAEMANEKKAKIYVRISAGASSNDTALGMASYITTSSNPVNGKLYPDNYDLSNKLLNKLTQATGAQRLGIYKTDDMTSLNYCKMPATSINLGFLTTPYDDRRLNEEEYQKEIEDALAEGIDEYFQESQGK